MSAFKYSSATIALLFATSLAYAQDSTAPVQPATGKQIECPAPGTVPDADLSMECKEQAGMSVPKASDATTEAPAAADSTATTTTEIPKTDSGAAATTATEIPKSGTDAAATTTEIPKADADAAATTTTEIPKTDADAAATTTTEIPKADADAAATTTTELPKSSTDTTTTTATEAPKIDTDTMATGTAEVPKTDTDAVTGSSVATGDAVIAPADVNPATAVLASQFMGQTVYSTGNENVGEINDLVMSKDLDTVVAVLGVGGFLGIGEKDVAVPIADITAVKDENNNLRLTIAATKEQLEAAPVFDRTALK